MADPLATSSSIAQVVGGLSIHAPRGHEVGRAISIGRHERGPIDVGIHQFGQHAL
jgi:hypothetical protein